MFDLIRTSAEAVAEKHASLGALYAPTEQLKGLAASGKGFHGE